MKKIYNLYSKKIYNEKNIFEKNIQSIFEKNMQSIFLKKYTITIRERRHHALLSAVSSLNKLHLNQFFCFFF